MNMEEAIYKSDGTPFNTTGHARNALRLKGLADTYEVMQLETGGYVGYPKRIEENSEEIVEEVKPKPTLIKKASGKKTRKVMVHWAIGDADNKELPISVCVNKPSNRMRFSPGEEVELSESQIGALKNAVEENELIIPPDSGIYASKDPLTLARNQYPGMRASYDKTTGQIKMIRRIPHYMVEYVD